MLLKIGSDKNRYDWSDLAEGSKLKGENGEYVLNKKEKSHKEEIKVKELSSRHNTASKQGVFGYREILFTAAVRQDDPHPHR